MSDLAENMSDFYVLRYGDEVKPFFRCRSLCREFPKVKLGYANGKKYCPRCAKFIVTEAIHCVCCGCNLRSKPFDIHLKEKRRMQLTV